LLGKVLGISAGFIVEYRGSLGEVFLALLPIIAFTVSALHGVDPSAVLTPRVP